LRSVGLQLAVDRLKYSVAILLAVRLQLITACPLVLQAQLPIDEAIAEIEEDGASDQRGDQPFDEAGDEPAQVHRGHALSRRSAIQGEALEDVGEPSAPLRV
jgi:hypothetical protein